MEVPKLGRLEKVDLREVWTREDSDFTPWLCEVSNLKLLGETIGIELEFEAQEKSVGQFSAEILCKDTASNTWVLIENQLERTDHTHLGQLLTYAAGLRAVTIVWISQEITEEHRAALDWLNEITEERFRFFGLEIEVWQIGQSERAPKFNMVSKPNDWSRTVTAGANRLELTEAKRLQLDFWTQFKTFVEENKAPFETWKAAPQNSMLIGRVFRRGFYLKAIASMWNSESNSYDSNELRAELVVDSENSGRHFEALKDMRESIESHLGGLKWYTTPNGRMRRVYARKDADLNDRKHWPEYFKWLMDMLKAFEDTFRPVVQSLEP